MKKNTNGYALIIVTCVIGFLLVFTGAVLKLALTELNDTKSRYDYLKAYYGAKGVMEYALLEIKAYGYGYCNGTGFTEIDCIFEDADSSTCKDDEKFGKYVTASFTVDTCTNSMDFTEGTLTGYAFDMIPLYTVSTGSTPATRGIYKPINSVLILESSISDDNYFSWNFIGEKGGLSGTGDVNATKAGSSDSKYREVGGDGKFVYSDKTINNLVSGGSGAFLLVRNGSGEHPVNYTLETDGLFSKPKSTITASAKVGDYKQNLKFTYDFSGRNSILSNAIYDAN